MEELRSTEILDREIQDDARRKAEKILKSGEAECRGIAEDTAVRIEAFRVQKEAEYAARIAAYRRDSEAAEPLEKQRKHVRFVDTAVQEALDRWFRDIGEKRRLSLFASLLGRYKAALGDSKLHIVCFGYSPEAVRAMAGPILGAERILSVTTGSDGEAGHGEDGLTVGTEDRRILCRATLGEIREELLSARRAELAAALFCGRLDE